MVEQQVKLKLESDSGQPLGFLVLRVTDHNQTELDVFGVDGTEISLTKKIESFLNIIHP